jgi:hypothetical protein
MNATADAVRAPRLTDKLLAEDLPVLLEVADAEIEYLSSRLADAGVGTVHESLQKRFRTRRDSLQRARVWLAGKLVAVATRRTDASHGEDE